MMQQTKATASAKKVRDCKKSRLLRNSDVRRWYDNIARGSPLTADMRIRRLISFCEAHKMSPMELAKLGMKDLRTCTDLLLDHISWMEQPDPERKQHPEPYAPGYIDSTIIALRSWLRNFDIEIKRKLKIANLEVTPTLEYERVPNGLEMQELFNRATLRASVAISLLAKSGVRPEALGNHDGSDGLMIGDLPDIVIESSGIARLLQSPPRIMVRRNLSKTRRPYFSFTTGNETSRLLAYLNERLAQGEALLPTSPVIKPESKYASTRGKNATKTFLPTRQISRIIRETFRPRFQWRPYVLRSYFDTQLLIAESRGLVAHDFRVFWMGHVGSIEATYTVNKQKLPDQLMDEMRQAFKRCEELLDLEDQEYDPIIKQKQELIAAIEKATPERVQEVLRIMGIGNT